MSSVERLREFVSERLTAAAEEIFGVFKQTVVEYEEEISRQRRLLDIVWKPEIKLHRIELPQQHVCTEEEEEVLTDQQLCVQERNSSLDQEDPEPPQIKEEVCTSREGEQLLLKQETGTFTLTPMYEEGDHCEDQSLNLNPNETIIAIEKESVVNIPVNVVSEPINDHQLFSHNSHVTESQDLKGGEHGDSGSTRDAEPEPKKRHHESRSASNNVYNPTMSEIHCNRHTAEKSFKCDTCGKYFKRNSTLNEHLRIHTGVRPYLCNTCGKAFRTSGHLIVHMRRSHTGEKPYLCKTCGRAFTSSGELSGHMRTHTGEKPHPCKTCGRAFTRSGRLTDHIRRSHAREEP